MTSRKCFIVRTILLLSGTSGATWCQTVWLMRSGALGQLLDAPSSRSARPSIARVSALRSPVTRLTTSAPRSPRWRPGLGLVPARRWRQLRRRGMRTRKSTPWRPRRGWTPHRRPARRPTACRGGSTGRRRRRTDRGSQRWRQRARAAAPRIRLGRGRSRRTPGSAARSPRRPSAACRPGSGGRGSTSGVRRGGDRAQARTVVADLPEQAGQPVDQLVVSHEAWCHGPTVPIDRYKHNLAEAVGRRSPRRFASPDGREQPLAPPLPAKGRFNEQGR